jgi:hypothetical protein
MLIVVAVLRAMLKTSAEPRLENLALRHQVAVLRRSAPKRLKITATDRLLWVWLRRLWAGWKAALVFVQPETVVAWHRKGFRLVWTWKVRRGRRGRPSVPPEIRDLIRTISRNNPRWGAPRIHGEMLKLWPLVRQRLIVPLGSWSEVKLTSCHGKPVQGNIDWPVVILDDPTN